MISRLLTLASLLVAVSGCHFASDATRCTTDAECADDEVCFDGQICRAKAPAEGEGEGEGEGEDLPADCSIVSTGDEPSRVVCVNERDFNAARALCQSLGLDLPVIPTPADREALEQGVRTADPYWLGLTDSDEEGAFVWIDGQPFTEGARDIVVAVPSDPANQDCVVTSPGLGATSVGLGFSNVSCTDRYATVCAPIGEGEDGCNPTQSDLATDVVGNFLACSPVHLAQFGALTAGETMVVTRDIDLSAAPWVPLAACDGTLVGRPGSPTAPKIIGLEISSPTEDNVAFCATLTGTVQDLKFVDATVTGRTNVAVVAGTATTAARIGDVVVRNATVTATLGRVAGIAGVVGGTSTAVSVTVIDRVAVVDSRIESLGGLNPDTNGISAGITSTLGRNSIVDHAVVLGTTIVDGRKKVGGLVGALSGTVRNSAVQDVKLHALNEVGGAAGVMNLNARLENIAIHDLKIEASEASARTGGLVGQPFSEENAPAVVEACAVGVVEGARDAVVGFVPDPSANRPITVTNVHYRGSSLVGAATADPPERFLHPDGFTGFNQWHFSAGVNPAPRGLLRPRCGNGIVDVGEACDSAGVGVGVDLSRERGCTRTCDVAERFVCGGPLSMCIIDDEIEVANNVNDLNTYTGIVYANFGGPQAVCLAPPASPFVLIGPGRDELTLRCDGQQTFSQRIVGISGLTLTGTAVDGIVKTTAGANPTRVVLAAVGVRGARKGVIVGAGTKASLVAVEIVGTGTPLVFNGSGLIANTLVASSVEPVEGVICEGGPCELPVTLSPAANRHLEARFNAFADTMPVVCAGAGTLQLTQSLAGVASTCPGLQVVNGLSGRLPMNVPGVVDGCGAGAADLAFDVDLQRRPVGAAFDCGADEASR